MSKHFENKFVWITGGGTGIGKAMALEFARQGASIAISGRRENVLEEACAEIEATGARALAVPCDVTVEDQVKSAVEAVVSHFGQLDVAVANAGFSVSGKVEDLSADEWRRQFDVNVVGAAMTAKYALPQLRETKGRLGLIGSVAGEIAFPKSGPYNASKYAVRALGQVLAMETAGTGVSTTLVQPGFVESDIAKVDNEGNYHEDWSDKRPDNLMWETDRAAKAIVKAIRKRKREYTFTAHGKAARFLGRHTPGLVHFAVTRFGK